SATTPTSIIPGSPLVRCSSALSSTPSEPASAVPGWTDHGTTMSVGVGGCVAVMTNSAGVMPTSPSITAGDVTVITIGSSSTAGAGEPRHAQASVSALDR